MTVPSSLILAEGSARYDPQPEYIEPMSSPDEPANPDESLNHQVDAICDRFEAAWKSGSAPSIEEFLQDVPGDTDHLLLELLKIDLEYRSKQDVTITPDEYSERFPEHALLIETVLQEAELDENRISVSPTDPMSPSGRHVAASAVIPKTIGPYKLLQKLGEGGMEAVYMADQLEPVRRRVALHLFTSRADSKQAVARFEAERQRLSRMDHQNIAKVLDAGITEDGTLYFAMELVQGMPITKYCDREKLSIEDRLQLFVQVCRALQHAHQKGIMHRDIKPSNVLVTDCDGVPVTTVINFGLAKALQSDDPLTDQTPFTGSGQVFGTLEYMSPEQAQMNEPGLDIRTDVYSLGVLLYELLTGSTPLGCEPVRREAFLVLIENTRCPSRRLSDSGDAITGICEQRRIEPRRLSRILKQELDWIAMKALEKDRNRRYDEAGSLADDVQNYLDRGVVTARLPSPGYRLRRAIRRHKVAFVSGMVLLLLLVTGLLGTRSIWLRSPQHLLTLNGHSKNVLSVSFSPDGKRIVSGSKDSTVKVWDAETGQETLTLNGHAREVASVSFSPRGQRIVSGSWDSTVKVWDAETGQETLTLNGHSDEVRSVRFSPDGKWIVSGSGNQSSRGSPANIKLWDAEVGEVTLSLTGHTRRVESVSFSPDGKRIVSTSYDNTVKLWDAETGEGMITLIGHARVVRSATFSPNGKRIASGSQDKTVKIWDAETGQELLTLRGHSDDVKSVSFSQDGKQIVSGSRDDTVIVWNAETGQEMLTLRGHSDDVMSVSFSPNGQRIVSGSRDGTVKVWDAILKHPGF
jgi:WD40 repeat protein/tRNA A-37 threonylcarbamoyl transferase component Bud32